MASLRSSASPGAANLVEYVGIWPRRPSRLVKYIGFWPLGLPRGCKPRRIRTTLAPKAFWTLRRLCGLAKYVRFWPLGLPRGCKPRTIHRILSPRAFWTLKERRTLAPGGSWAPHGVTQSRSSGPEGLLDSARTQSSGPWVFLAPPRRNSKPKNAGALEGALSGFLPEPLGP